jgi:hypothetical protein
MVKLISSGAFARVVGVCTQTVDRWVDEGKLTPYLWNDEWALQRARYMTLETIEPLSNDPIVKLPAMAA